MTFCGIDLAVKRKTDVALLSGNKATVYEVDTDEEIVSLCSSSRLIAIDSPLLLLKYRDVDKEMIRRGFKVLPPSFMVSLVERAISLRSFMSMLETHPTSSLKNADICWRDLSKKKDIIDAVISAMAARLYYEGKAQVIEAHDGKVILLPKGRYNIIPVGENRFYVFYI
ncbi:DUF429 domain-containing protein [Sulfuracidifex metallicus]|uniref:DUF429 domain-containing protein n=1 Tax=Sulfuracidifex metallicus TaxID=47303 RepID=UPI0006D09F3D|nr:hypothetical protein [Sulfuracidifex metallicus]WOE49992.1 hypothetical protein RQ359_001489 [Sulfuracidifex metallicus DSM 6482 = JCM 9184]